MNGALSARLLAGSSATIAAALGELLAAEWTTPPPVGLLLHVGGRNVFLSAAE